MIDFQGKADEAKTKNNTFYNELLPLDLKNNNQIKKLFQDLASLQAKIDSLKSKTEQNLKKNLKKDKRDLVEKELSILQEKYKHLQTSITMEQLGLISEIECNFYWIHYVYQLIFYEISLVNSNIFVSFRDLRKILKTIKKNLEIQKRKPSFLILKQKSAGIETIQQNDLTPTCFHTRDEGTIALRKKIFDNLTDILIDSVLNLQYMEFRQILAENVTKITERCVLKNYQDHFLLSNFISMLTYFCGSRNFPFIANCFEDVYYTSYYKQAFTTEFTYNSDLLSKNKLEKKRKKVVKFGIQGTEPDPDKSFIAAPANFVQAFDSEILIKVVTALLNKFHKENCSLWVGHDCFVITPNLVTTLEQSYKKAFVDTFFKNSQDFLFSEFGVEIKFELARNSPIYIFQILIISNFFNMLDDSLQGGFPNLSEEKKREAKSSY